VVPLVCREWLAVFRGSIIDELVALALGKAFRSRGRLPGRCPRLVPRFAAVIRALDDLPEPAAGLRRIEPVRINRRSLQMVDLPASKVGPADIPLLALAVRCQQERALAGTNQNTYFAHLSLLPESSQ